MLKVSDVEELRQIVENNKDVDYPCSRCGKVFQVPYKEATMVGNTIVCPFCGGKELVAHDLIIRGTVKSVSQILKDGKF